MQTALYSKIKEERDEWLIGANTQNVPYLSIVARQYKTKQRHGKKWAVQQLSRNKKLICVKEKALEKLRYHNIKVKQSKIKDARISNNKMFQEDQGMFYRKTQGTKQLRGKVPKM